MTKKEKIDSVVKKIKPLKPTDNLELKILVYGRSGSGKTTLLSSLPKPLLYIDCKEKGSKSIMGVEGIDFIEIEDWDTFEDIWWMLDSDPSKYASVVIDTVTQLQELAIEKVKEDNQASQMSQRLWGEVGEKVKTWTLRYRDLPMNVGFAAQERVRSSDDSSLEVLNPEVGPAVSPSIATALNASVDIIANSVIMVKRIKVKDPTTGLTKTKDKYIYSVKVGPDPVYLTKVRNPKDFILPDNIEDPSYEDLIKITKGIK